MHQNKNQGLADFRIIRSNRNSIARAPEQEEESTRNRLSRGEMVLILEKLAR